MIGIINDMETLLNSNENFLLGNWLEAAKAYGTTEDEKKLYEFNARNQITLWGPTGQIVDYAAKAWGGLYSSFYLDRWNTFIDAALYALSNNEVFNGDAYHKEVLLKEQQWGMFTDVFPTTPVGNSVAIANSLLNKYANATSTHVTYTKFPATDAPGNDLLQTWTKDIEQLKILCAMDPGCMGFNSNGWMKYNVNGTVTSPADLYTKN